MLLTGQISLKTTPWVFQSDIENKKIDADNMKTTFNQALNQLDKIETEINVLTKMHQDLLCQAKNVDNPNKRSSYLLNAEEKKGDLEILKSKKEHYDNIIKNFNEQECINAIKTYNKYIDTAKNFINDNNLHDVVNIELMLSQSRMENHIMSLYEQAQNEYEKYKDLKKSWLYTMFPILRPWNYAHSMKEHEKNLLNAINKITTLITAFPETKQHIIDENIRKKCFMKISAVFQKALCENKSLNSDEVKIQAYNAVMGLNQNGFLTPQRVI